jgi:hypothetical protein
MQKIPQKQSFLTQKSFFPKVCSLFLILSLFLPNILAFAQVQPAPPKEEVSPECVITSVNFISNNRQIVNMFI